MKVGILLTDISGAFDRVDPLRLIDKCRAAGVGDAFCDFLEAYLSPRSAYVVVDGVCSEVFKILNQVFQGTVLGPLSWKVFFSDADEATSRNGFSEYKFADDLAVIKSFCASANNGNINDELHHAGGHTFLGDRNRVKFYPAKEKFKLLHTVDSSGDAFRLLGVLIDANLAMNAETSRIRKKARAKMKALLGALPRNSSPNTANQCKARVWQI